MDLEKELSCSICTDVLYQPLTLLDCLHTFCGSCLKEWFSWQATSAANSRKRIAHPYTCPSCRATVRAARPNANVTTLLEMFLATNPDKGKSEQEKEEMRRHFTPGDDVLPPVSQPQARDGYETDSEDEQLIDAVREISVADLNPAVEANRRDARRRDRIAAARGTHDQRRGAIEGTERSQTIARDMSHQPSLRSLLSASGEDAIEVQEEILASILSSGMLDGIDTDNLTTEQEEELTERIAEAYRERQRRHQRHSRNHRPREDASTEQHHQSQTRTTPPRSRPASSRPHLIEQWTQELPHAQRQSLSSSERRRNSSHSRNVSSGSTELRAAARSATDLAPRMENDHNRSREVRRLEAGHRSTTEPARSSTMPPAAPPSYAPIDARTRATQPHRTQSEDQAASRGSTHETMHTHDSPSSAITAPSLNCDRCAKPSIQYQLHYHCSKCNQGSYNICRQCYRAGKGCLHWTGFGYAAYARWQRSAPVGGWPADAERPHILAQRRYQKSRSAASDKLHDGVFCEKCFEFADKGYWHCRTCFEGAWGFCTTCVRKSRHCTHPLTPVSYSNDPDLKAAALPHLEKDKYRENTISSKCAVCSQQIPFSHGRYHCSSCNDGDYEICRDSYAQLVATGKISSADGESGWRRCLAGHPLDVVAYQRAPDGAYQRVVLSDPVGGWKAGHASRYGQASPAISSHTFRAQAYWSWFPADGVDDELTFPKLAEIAEVEKVNADYSVGVYAGSRGLFPANHVKEL